jgi:hypothetical protein
MPALQPSSLELLAQIFYHSTFVIQQKRKVLTYSLKYLKKDLVHEPIVNLVEIAI